jgi:UDPglucose 6-dehydrogenase
MYKIGIVGNGFVGSAVAYGFSPQTTNLGEGHQDVKIFDVDEKKSTHSLDETVNSSDFIFMSVPTPSNKDGSINLDIVYAAVSDINDVNRRDDNILVIRSTMVPGSTRELQETFPKLNIVFNPEFLTERSAKFDFINPARFVIGGEKENSKKLNDLFKWRFGNSVLIIETDFETAEFIKYMNNCFFATKVSFMNDVKLVADKCGVNWDDAVDGFVSDGRVGHSHLMVPGPDGKMGFGGSCFPKDINAFMTFAESVGVEVNTIKGAWETNLYVRPEKDWRELKGRAVVDEEN